MSVQQQELPVAIIGAGPVGLAAAAHLVRRGLTPLVFEAGPSVASSFESVRHVRLFSPWHLNIDRAARELLLASGWREPQREELPTAGEMIDLYLRPLAVLPALAPQIKLNHRVAHVTRQGFDKVKTQGRDAAPFLLRVQADGREHDVLARAVIDTSGSWFQPNPLGGDGLPALGEAALSARIHYGMPDILSHDRQRYAGKRVLVVGAGHSAAGNLIALATLAEQAPGTSVVWAIRGSDPDKVFGGGAADGLPARGRLGTRLAELKQSGRFELHTSFRIRALRASPDGIEIIGGSDTPAIARIDEIICATGSRPDLAMTRELRLQLDPWLESPVALAPLIDPNLHSCGSVRPHGHRALAHPEAGFYAAGAKSYGRAPNFLMATGYEQVRSIVAALAGDLAAADDVQLQLPETGVCSIGALFDQTEQAGQVGASVSKRPSRVVTVADAGCCGGPAPNVADACCVADAAAKSEGKAGCGCSPSTAETPAKTGCCAA